MRQITYALLISFLAATAVCAQESGPKLLSGGESGLSPLRKSTAIQTQASVDRQGRIRGTSVTDRLSEIRRRAVDADISRPFSVTDETDPQVIELHGALPAVPRRTVEKVTPETVSTRIVRKTVEKPAVTPQPVVFPDPEPVNFPEPEVKQAPVQVVEAPKPVAVPLPQPKPEPKPDPEPVKLAPVVVAQPAPVVAQPAPVVEQPAPVIVATQEIKKKSDILLSNNVPALSFETAGPKQIRIGREATYRVSMVNNGEASARDVIVKVNLPAWAEITRTNATIGSPQVELDRDRSYTVTWELGQLGVDGKEDLMLGIVPRDSRPFDLSVGWTLAAARSATQIEVQEPKLEMTVNGARDVHYGETSIYTIVLSNPGTGDAEKVSLSLMPLTPHQEIAGTRTIGTLKAGERKTIELELTAHQAGQLQVRAIANAEGGLRADASQDVFVRRANLEVAIIGPPRNFAGTEATYKVRIENTGDATAEKAAASAIIPPSARYVSSNDGGKFDTINNRVEWNVGTLRPGAVRVLEFRCVLETAGENRIDVSSIADGDLQITKSVATQVEALADLKLYVNDPKGPISVGQDSIYEVKIVNRGTKTADNIKVVGYFSDGIEPLDIRGWRGTVSTGQVQFEPIASLSAGQEIVFRITARASAPGNHVFRAEVECRAPETRLAAEEWTKYYGAVTGEIRQATRPQQQPTLQSSGRQQFQGQQTLSVPQQNGSESQFYLPEVRR